MKMVKTTPFNFFDHPILKRDFSRLCLSLKWGMLIKVGKVAKMMGKVGSASFSKSNSLFNPSHAFWLTASIQILSWSANFLTMQFAKRTAFLRKREEKKVLQAKPPIVSTLFQSFLDTQRVN